MNNFMPKITKNVQPAKPAAKRTSSPTDFGGTSARRGFKFQDHVAAKMLLQLVDGEFDYVKCETSDDVEVGLTSNNKSIIRYIQAKTTDGDRKWSCLELCKGKGKNPKSIYEKSLQFDNEPTKSAEFALYTTRGIDKSLHYLSIPQEERDDPPTQSKLAKLISKHSKKLTSPIGNDSDYWVNNCTWVVYGSIEDISSQNQKRLFAISDKYGCVLSHTDLVAIYDELLEMADAAATASSKTAKSKKTITKGQVKLWWEEKIRIANSSRSSKSLPYFNKRENFLIEFHHLSEDDVRRGITGMDVGYDNGQWRSGEFANHLMEWLPEIALKASEVSKINHTNFLLFFNQALQAISDRMDIVGDELLGDILLHVCIRQKFDSEPIACKVFYTTLKGSKCFPNAHIVRSDGKEELWLGRAIIKDSFDLGQSTSIILDSLAEYLDRDFLKRERQVLLQLKESQFLRPNSLEKILYNNTPVDEFVSHLAIPILIAYDSPVLADGYIDDYINKLTMEVSAHYDEMKNDLSVELEKIKIHVFLLPFEDCQNLLSQFQENLKK